MARRSLDVHVYVRNIVPRIWRRLRLRASTPLHAFATRVLMGAFACSIGEHSYAYSLPTRAYPGRRRPPPEQDVSFQDLGATTVDAMCHRASHFGHNTISAADVTLGDVLRDVGDVIRWTYDFGDAIEHEIELVAAHDEPLRDASGRSVVLLDGARAGVPENPGSIYGYACKLEELATTAPPTARAAHQRAIADWKAQNNWSLHASADGRSYDAAYFNKARFQRLIDALVAEPGGLVFDAMASTRPDAAAAGGRACATCGKAPAVPAVCSACKNAVYCDAACQRSDWPRHKLMCAKTHKPAARRAP